MACLNLPIDIRYKPENMYLAIIPGPNEPHLEQINYYLRPLIDDMAIAWDRGIHITRTPRYPEGRDTNSAVAAVVCDLPAARKASAMAGHSSHFYCSACDCYHLSTRHRTDFESWLPRDHHILRAQAEAWRDAKSSAERQNIFDVHGVRWSELWRLSYWNPTKQLVTDPMHCLLEGLAQFHARQLLHLDGTKSTENPPAFSGVCPPASAHAHLKNSNVVAINNLLTSPIDGRNDEEIQIGLQLLADKLHRKNLPSLAIFAAHLGLNVTSAQTKRGIVKSLIEWVSVSLQFTALDN
jgi:hypothetical protein